MKVEQHQLTNEQIVVLRKEQENYGNRQTTSSIRDREDITRTSEENREGNNSKSERAGSEAESTSNNIDDSSTSTNSGSEVQQRGVKSGTSQTTTTEEVNINNISADTKIIFADNSQQQTNSNRYSCLAFDNPAQLYAYFRPSIQSGDKNFHKWQAEELIRISANDYTIEHPLKLLLPACNGSGKDSYVIAPTAIWLSLCKIRHRTIITSASYNQINTQTEPYIVELANTINEHFGEKIFDIIKGLITCNLTGSEIRLFVTDEPGRVEGYHPFDDTPGAEMTVILNEAKSIPDEIIEATARWTGFTRWIEVSSTGLDTGKFFEKCQFAVEYPNEYHNNEWYMRRITVYDCPHISKSQLQDDARLFGGITSAFYRSKNLSEFTNAEGEPTVISKEQIRECIEVNVKWDGDCIISAGLDLALGGDEVVLISRKGNLVNKLSAFRQRDATVLRDLLIAIFPSHGITKDTAIYTDASGLGEPVCNMLRELGWNIIMIKNNTRAYKPNLFANRGTELYFSFAVHISMLSINLGSLTSDSKLCGQLSNRHYDRPDNDKIKLWDKKDEKKSTLLGNSPDRADALILAFANFQTTESRSNRRERQDKLLKNVKRITQTELVEVMSQTRYAGYEGDIPSSKNRPKPLAYEQMLNQTAILEYNLKLLQEKN